MRGWKLVLLAGSDSTLVSRTLSPDNEGMETLLRMTRDLEESASRTLSPDNEGMETKFARA